MQLRIQKNSRLVHLALLVLLALPMLASAPSLAFAANTAALNPASARDCITATNNTGLTVRIVGCTKQIILDATDTVANVVADYAGEVVPLLATLSILFIGVMLMGGHAQWNEALLAVVRIAFVTVIIADISTYFTFITDILDEMTNMVTIFNAADIKSFINASCTAIEDAPEPFNSVSPVWFGVDCAIDTIVGGISTGISNGMLGFFTTALFSGTIGAVIALAGAFMVYYVFIMLSQALFVYISALVAIALLVIISPLCIPAILFNSTRQYFTAWLGMLFNFVLQPIILFAYLSMMMVAMGNVVFMGENSIVKVVTSGQVDLAQANNAQTFGKYVAKAYTKKSLASAAININPEKASQELGEAELARTGNEGNVLRSQITCGDNSGTDCLGTKPKYNESKAISEQNWLKIDQPVNVLDWERLGGVDEEYILKVLISVLSALITIFIFLELLKQLPYIGNAISGGGEGIPAFGTGKFAASENAVLKNLQAVFSGGGK